jgi:capsular polysaccharide biosynthesis protein
MSATRFIRRITRAGIDRTRRHALRAWSAFTGPTGPLTGYVHDLRQAAVDCGGSWHACDPAEADDPATGVATLPGGRVLFDYGVIADHRRRLVGEASWNLGSSPDRHPVLAVSRIPPPRPIAGSIAVLSSTAHQRYFHWMFDVLPRLDILRRAEIRVDAVIVNATLPFQLETLDLVGLDPSQVIDPAPDSHWQAERLVVPSLPGRVGHPSRRAVRFLRSLYPPSSARGTRRLYVSRADAATRRVVNEAAVSRVLAARGFECVDVGRLSVAAQARLFSDAEIVCGPHGASFTNLVFAPAGATLVELMPSSYREPCFARLTALLGQRHDALICESVDASTTHDMHCAPDALAAAVDRLLVC